MRSSKAANNDDDEIETNGKRIGAYCTLRGSRTQHDNAIGSSSTGCGEIGSSSYCTMSRKLRQIIKPSEEDNLPPYKKLKESKNDLGFSSPSCSSSINFGLSNSLSSESIRNACDCFELSDSGNESNQIKSRKCTTLDRRRKPSASAKQENLFCTLRRDNHKNSNNPPPTTTTCSLETLGCTLANAKSKEHHSSLTLNQEEAINILNELDAILDDHAITLSSASSMGSSSAMRSEPEKVEDCLLELDTYLDGMEERLTSSEDEITNCNRNGSDVTSDGGHRSKTLPRQFRHDAVSKGKHPELTAAASTRQPAMMMNRGHNFRRTIASGALRNHRQANDAHSAHHQHHRNGSSTASSQHGRKEWRRNSMRKTSLLAMPDHKDAESDEGSSHGDPLQHVQLYPLPATRRSLSQSDCRSNENLTNVEILNNIVRPQSESATPERPRQFGRRSDCSPRIVSIRAETNSSGTRRIIVNHDRPMSAPAASALVGAGRRVIGQSSLANDCSRYIGSEPSSVGSSRNPSPVSLLSSTGSSSIGSTGPEPTNTASLESGNLHNTRTSSLDPDNITIAANQGMNSYWPHGLSRILGLLCCTLGLFNISRFAIQTIHYGGNFVLQFLLLSVVFGIPMLWLQMCLGAKIKAGPVSMWKISPICKGIGISLVLVQSLIALYSTVSLAWCMVYLRDSFLTKSHQHYNWQEPFYIYRRSGNGSAHNLTETTADYFNGIVLQRWQLGLGRHMDSGGVRFQIAFNLAIIWTVVFLILCKGLKTFGRVVIGLMVVPLVLFLVVSCKLLYIIDFSTVQEIFSASDFEDFLINSKTWTAAAQESFLTWALLGSSVVSMSSRSSEKNANSKTVLRRDAIIVVLLTLFGLSLAGIFGYACVQILQNNDYLYLPGSYEHMDTYISLYSLKTPINPNLISLPAKWAPHYSTVLGETYRRPQVVPFRESGYQSLRLITELFPATVAVAQDSISSVWTVMAFFMFTFFGLAQLCAMWKPISIALGESTSSVLLSCVIGLLLGIPFATEMGISIIHFLDVVIGGAWWILILWTAQILGVFLIRGRPYNGDVLVNDLRMTGSMSAFLALSWNVLLPIGMVALAVIEYKISLSNQFFHWRGKAYFSYWARKVGGLTQVGFLLLVPLTAIVQIYRYLTSGPPDILDRIQLLYRPTMSPQPHRRNRPSSGIPGLQPTSAVGATNLEPPIPHDDAPPKYTPPPSYTTATGARLAKILRQSIRRSVRRFLGEPSRTRPTLPHTSTLDDGSLPPEYSTVLSNPSGSCNQDENIEIGPRALYNSYTQRTLSLGRNQRAPQIEPLSRPESATSCISEFQRSTQPFTATDVAQVLRSSSRHPHHERSASSTIATKVQSSVDHVLRSSSLRNKSSRSVENLVLNAAPLGESSAIVLNESADTLGLDDENTSVI